jgi:hypothetical protein
MKRLFLLLRCGAGVLACAWFAAARAHAQPGPFDGKTFKGRIAWSADGNFNDPDDWIASPVALAIFAECGLKDRLVHFDNNCILPRNNPEWEKINAESVMGAAERYGYNLSVFHDCQKDREGAVASIARAIDASSAEDPLYFVVAGPMEVPYLGIQKSNPEKRQFVYCISHSRWNDGFSANKDRHDFFTYNKRSVIESGINWVQIQDQNRLLSHSRYGRPAEPEEFAPYFWMRDSQDPRVKFLWERMLISTRPDPSDAGMAWFLVTGDEEADPAKLKRLLEDHVVPAPVKERARIRLEAENFSRLEGFELEDRNDRDASHRLNVKPGEGRAAGRIQTRLHAPYNAAQARYDVDVRYLDEPGRRCRLTLSLNGAAEDRWETPGEGRGWTTHTVQDLDIAAGAVIAVEAEGQLVRVDYIELRRRAVDGRAAGSASRRVDPRGDQPRAAHRRFTAAGPLDDPAALPGQIIVAGANPGYLKYNGGGPAFLCGPDNPEEFLFLGTPNADGTRSGGQQEELIDIMARAGVNAFHCQTFRMRQCNIKDEGDDQHCPFVDHDPSQPLNTRVLDQWDGWLTRLEAAGIVVHLELYNDATDVERMGWTLDANGELHADERRYVEGIVNRFKHHRNVIWGVEESFNKLPRARTPHFRQLSALIARADDHHHPVVHSFVTPDTAERDLHPDAVMSGDYRDDPRVDIVTWLHIAPRGNDYEAQHREYLKWAARDSDRFIAMRNETEYQRIDRTALRRHHWGCALAGMHALEAQLTAARADRRDRLPDAGKVVAFMEQTDWHTMKPQDDLAAGSTRWVLARPGESCIAYSYDCSDKMGVKGLAAGTYDLLWFDTITGEQARQCGVAVAGGDVAWSKPESFGAEVALYVKRQAPAKL